MIFSRNPSKDCFNDASNRYVVTLTDVIDLVAVGSPRLPEVAVMLMNARWEVEVATSDARTLTEDSPALAREDSSGSDLGGCPESWMLLQCPAESLTPTQITISKVLS